MRGSAGASVASGSAAAALRGVLVATDLSPGARAALTRAAHLPLAPDGVITLLHVLPDASHPATDAMLEAEARRALDAAAVALARGTPTSGAAPRINLAIRRGRPFVEVIRFARESRVDLVVVGRHRRRPLRDLFLGTTAERVIRKGDAPVLLVNRDARGPYRRPLVAVDLSEPSRRAFELALRVAGPGIDEVDVVHAYEPPHAPALGLTIRARRQALARRDEHRRALRGEIQAAIAAAPGGPRCKVHLRIGDPRDVIRQQIARRRPDLVTLGSRGLSGLAHLLIGSVAEAVVREAPCDVLVARPAERIFTLP